MLKPPRKLVIMIIIILINKRGKDNHIIELVIITLRSLSLSGKRKHCLTLMIFKLQVCFQGSGQAGKVQSQLWGQKCFLTN